MKQSENLTFHCLQVKNEETADDMFLNFKTVNETINYIQKNLPFTDDIKCYYILDFDLPFNNARNGHDFAIRVTDYKYFAKITKNEVIYPCKAKPSDDKLFFALLILPKADKTPTFTPLYNGLWDLYEFADYILESDDMMAEGETWIIEDYDGNYRAKLTMYNDDYENDNEEWKVDFYDLQGNVTKIKRRRKDGQIKTYYFNK